MLVWCSQNTTKIFLNSIRSCKHWRLFSTKVKVSSNDLIQYSSEMVRNFSIIAHVDHGKSTLADRLLEFTGAINPSSSNKQVLDKLPVEKERGITVKAQTAALFYEYRGKKYLLNLIDTPGHVDFNHEVRRSLTASDAVILLVDANEGVQAQTVANFYLAFERDLVIIPVLNKIDLPNADPEGVKVQLKNLFEIDPSTVIEISAKRGTNVDKVIEAVILRTPSPHSKMTSYDANTIRQQPVKALVFDMWYESFKGVIAQVLIKEGTLSTGDQVFSHFSKKPFSVKDVGILTPEPVSITSLYAGQVGYVIAGMRSPRDFQVGDTICHASALSQPPIATIQAAKPMVFAGLYPDSQENYQDLNVALSKLVLNDSSVQVTPDVSGALGAGWRLGFLGLLHMDVFRQRLEQEYDTSVIITTPSVPYRVEIHGEKNIKSYGTNLVTVHDMTKLPPVDIIVGYQEFRVTGTIIAPTEFHNEIMKLVSDRRGGLKDQSELDGKRTIYRIIFPLSEIVVGFYDRLKSITSGYASFDYEDLDWFPADLVKLDTLLNDEIVGEMTLLCHVTRARQQANIIASQLAKDIPRQQFHVKIQVAVGRNILAREDVKPYRKDVLQGLHGREISRNIKLLKNQAEGKKRLRSIGKVSVPKDAFINVLKRPTS